MPSLQAEIIDAKDVAVLIRSLNKTYSIDDLKIDVLKDISLQVFPGEFVAIYGASGSGKTTLLNLISGIDKPTSGILRVFGEDLAEKDENDLSDFRCQKIGFVFQSYNLVSTLTVAENIAFPMEWIRKSAEEIESRVSELLKILGIQHRENHFPAQLSGGEQQRVAFARALANDPPLLLADEPTGNLDGFNVQKIIEIFKMLKQKGKTAIVSTHDPQIMQLTDKALHLKDERTETNHV